MLILATDRYLAVDMYRGHGSAFSTSTDAARVFLDDLRPDFADRMTAVVAWEDATWVDVVDPWPSFALAWRNAGLEDRYVFRRMFLEGDQQADEMETAVVELVDYLERRGRAELIGDRGWLDYPHVEWELVILGRASVLHGEAIGARPRRASWSGARSLRSSSASRDQTSIPCRIAR